MLKKPYQTIVKELSQSSQSKVNEDLQKKNSDWRKKNRQGQEPTTASSNTHRRGRYPSYPVYPRLIVSNHEVGFGRDNYGSIADIRHNLPRNHDKNLMALLGRQPDRLEFDISKEHYNAVAFIRDVYKTG